MNACTDPRRVPSATVQAALQAAGLDAALAERAEADHSYAGRVAAEHRELVEQTRSFGVPTFVLDAGRGPAIFGPVIREPPATDAEALELFDHVVWLAHYDNFSELKRDRVGLPDLMSRRNH